MTRENDLQLVVDAIRARQGATQFEDGGRVDLCDLNLPGWSLRRVTAFVRAHAERLGGRYVSARKIPGNPRAFNCDQRSTRWVPARFVPNNVSDES